MQNPCLYKKWRDTLSYNVFSESGSTRTIVKVEGGCSWRGGGRVKLRWWVVGV